MDGDRFFELLFHPFAMLWCGQLLHTLKLLRETEAVKKSVSLKKFIGEHKYAILFSVVAGIVVYGVLHTSGQMNQVAAFTAGYMADSMVNTIARRGERIANESPDAKG